MRQMLRGLGFPLLALVLLLGGLTATMGLLVSSPAHALPTVVGEGAFASTPIDSNVADDVLITNQLPGMLISGGLFGEGPDAVLIPGAGALATANFSFDQSGDITIDLSSAVIRFGLVIATNDPDDITLTVFSGGSNLGSLNYVTGLAGVFAGIEELSGFDRVVINVNGADNGAFVADLFRFDLRSTGVPAPATLALLGAGLLGLAWRRRQIR